MTIEDTCNALGQEFTRDMIKDRITQAMKKMQVREAMLLANGAYTYHQNGETFGVPDRSPEPLVKFSFPLLVDTDPQPYEVVREVFSYRLGGQIQNLVRSLAQMNLLGSEVSECTVSGFSPVGCEVRVTVRSTSNG